MIRFIEEKSFILSSIPARGVWNGMVKKWRKIEKCFCLSSILAVDYELRHETITNQNVLIYFSTSWIAYEH